MSKPGKDEKRPLGIPAIEDRARQALVKLVLEPEWEAKFEPNSYGFRPARSCHDAIEAIYRQIRLVPKWVLDADIAGCFDNINHEALLGKLGTFPKLRRVIKAWLKSGVLDEGTLFPTEEGTPQGGVISPLLANIALHGLEETVKAAFPENRFIRKQNLNVRWKPQIVRYADDFVILHRDRYAIEKAQKIAAEWLKQMGLEMKPSKTKIVHTLEVHDGQVGFDFLGFNIRQYPRSESSCIRKPKTGKPTGFTPSIRPSKKSQRQLLRKVKQILKSNRAVISKNMFRKLHSLIYEQLRSWTQYRHRNKGHKWIARKYWSFSDKWEFGVRDRIKLVSLPDIPIRRHVGLRVNKSPFDGDWIYWSQRLGQYPDMPKSKAIRLRLQDGVCSSCGLHFCPDDEMVILHLDGNNKNFRRDNMTLVHRRCVTTVRSMHTDAAFN
jgi:RNA-directed DNA polymerase